MRFFSKKRQDYSKTINLLYDIHKQHHARGDATLRLQFSCLCLGQLVNRNSENDNHANNNQLDMC